MKRQKDLIPEDELSMSVGVQYGEEQRNSFRKKEEAGPKRKWSSAVDVSGDEIKI